MAAEIPKVPKNIALFQQDDYPGVEYEPNEYDVNPAGQPFGNSIPSVGPPHMGAMGGDMFQAPMMGQPPMLPQGAMQGPMMGPPQAPQAPMQGPSMQGGFSDQGMMGGMGGGMPGMGMPQQPQMPAPVGAQAQSPGPIGRLKQMLNEMQARDPQQWMLMMAALTQGATNPNLAIGMGQQAVTGQREQALKQQQIDATREYKQQTSQDKQDYRFRMKTERLHGAAQRGGIDPSDYMPDDGVINTPEEQDYAELKITQGVATKHREEARDKAMGGALKGLDPPRRYANDRDFMADYSKNQENYSRLMEIKEEYLQLAKNREQRLKEKHTASSDPAEQKRFQLQLLKIRDLQSRLEGVQAQVNKRTDLNVFGKLELFREMYDKIERELTNAYGSARYMAEGGEMASGVGAGTKANVEPGVNTINIGEPAPATAPKTDDNWKKFQEMYIDDEPVPSGGASDVGAEGFMIDTNERRFR